LRRTRRGSKCKKNKFYYWRKSSGSCRPIRGCNRGKNGWDTRAQCKKACT
jgi:hypothetical protein